MGSGHLGNGGRRTSPCGAGIPRVPPSGFPTQGIKTHKPRGAMQAEANRAMRGVCPSAPRCSPARGVRASPWNPPKPRGRPGCVFFLRSLTSKGCPGPTRAPRSLPAFPPRARSRLGSAGKRPARGEFAPRPPPRKTPGAAQTQRVPPESPPLLSSGRAAGKARGGGARLPAAGDSRAGVPGTG